MDCLHMARLFAFEPQFVARAAEIHGPPEFCSFLQSFAVHPGKHQHIAATLLLDNHGHQAFFIPAHGIQPSGRWCAAGHSRTAIPRAAICAFTWPTVNSP